jgi:hypothetical protein
VKRTTLALTAFWLLACAGGLYALGAHAGASGAVGAVPRRWPSGAAARPESSGATLLLFAHPRCPCTRAALDELAWVLARSRGRATARVFFYRPLGAAAGWERTPLWDEARALGARVAADPDGAQARAFGARTSGMVVIYGAEGRLLYEGGITAGRAQEGDGPGREAAVAAIEGKLARPVEGSVFGCALIASKAEREAP